MTSPPKKPWALNRLQTTHTLVYFFCWWKKEYTQYSSVPVPSQEAEGKRNHMYKFLQTQPMSFPLMSQVCILTTLL